MQLIITNHHEPLIAGAVISPTFRRIIHSYALRGRRCIETLPCAFEFERAMEAIDVVAMATVADIVPLLDEKPIHRERAA